MRKTLVVTGSKSLENGPGLWRAKWWQVWTRLLVILVACSLMLGACGPNPTEAPKPAETVSPNLKISSILLNVFVTYNTAAGSDEEKKKAAIQYARENKIVNAQDEAIFELELDDAGRQQAVNDKIKAMGGTVRNASNLDGTVKLRVSVPIDAFVTYTNTATKDHFLADLAAFQGVKSIDLLVGRPALGFENLPQSTAALLNLAQVSKNEGVKLMGADKWQTAGFRGKGARIGVIDSGFKFYQKFRGSTLPAGLEVKDVDREFGGPGTIEDSVHGTAVLEIIYSLAPEAEIFAVSIDGSDGEFKAALDYLLSQKVSIISASLGGHSGPGDGRSQLDREIEKIRKEKGVVFLFSAGNEGSAHYSAFFNPDPDGFHQFVPGVTRMAVGNPRNATLDTYFILNWEQWGLDKSTVNDLDIFVTDRNGNPIKASQDSQRVRNPLEQLPIKIPAKTLYYVRVKQKAGTPAYTKPFRLHIFGHNTTFQFFVPQMAVADPASSKGALGVGAIQWNEDKWAYYSSQGPLPDGTFKPEISAPAGVTSRAYEEEGGDVFDGTSAACPEAAGIAAILKGANPNLTADQLDALLKESVKDLAPAGPDYGNGYGRVSIGELRPAAGIVPQGKAPGLPRVDIATLQYPVLVFKGYPTPQVDTVAGNKLGPVPLPTRVVGLENGATTDSRVGGTGSATQPPPVTTTPAPSGSAVRPQNTPLPVSNVTFRDDFKDIASGLPSGSNSAYQNGSYRLKASAGQLTWTAYPSSAINVSDFGAQVTAKGIADRNGLYGLVFWHQDATSYFLLSVTGTGQYQISQYSGGSYREVIPWNTAAGWKSGGTNLIRLATNEGNISVYFNDQPGKAGQAKGQGSLGFAAGSYSGPVEASFSDFRLSTSGK